MGWIRDFFGTYVEKSDGFVFWVEVCIGSLVHGMGDEMGLDGMASGEDQASEPLNFACGKQGAQVLEEVN